MRSFAAILLLAAALAAAPKLKDKPKAPPDYRYIQPGLEFDTADGYRVRVDKLYTDDPEWRDRAYCEYRWEGPNGWTLSPVFVDDAIPSAPGYFNRRPPTLAHVDALYRGTLRLDP